MESAFTPIQLPCGRTVSNRFVKVSMYEHLSKRLGGPPNASLNALYECWSQGDWGMIFTGNVQVDPEHLSLGWDVVIPKRGTHDTQQLEKFKQWANTIKGSKSGNRNDRRPLAIMQLSHAGRQSPNFLGGRRLFKRPLSSSATRVGTGPNNRASQNASFAVQWISCIAYAIFFQTAREATLGDIDAIVDAFVRAAQVAFEAGFDGVELHSAHGYLLSQFMSRRTNLRTDAYSDPLALLRRITSSIRANVPSTFIVGVKINCSDYISGAAGPEAEKLATEHLREISSWGLDFIEVSGGDYEVVDFVARSSVRQAFFESFSRTAVSVLATTPPGLAKSKAPLVLLTGGLRCPSQIASALNNNHAHLLGFGRMSILQPDLPRLIRCRLESGQDTHSIHSSTSELDSLEEFESKYYPEPQSPKWWPRLVGSGIAVGWYTVSMSRMAKAKLGGKELKMPYGLGSAGVLAEMWFGVDGDLVELWAPWVLLSLCAVVSSIVILACAFEW